MNQIQLKTAEIIDIYAWQLNNGERIMTNDPNFNPFRDLGIDGYELKRVQ